MVQCAIVRGRAMYQIRDWLCISGYPEASSLTIVKAAGIGAMLQLFEPFELEGVETHYIPVIDGQPITKGMIRDGMAFIRQQMDAKKKLLITCGAGISRSVMFSVIALKEIEGLSMDEAYRTIYALHPKALPDHVHWQSVAEYYNETDDFWKIWGNLMLGDEP